MQKNLHHIDELFRETIESYEKQPSAAVWKDLEARLDKEDAIIYKRKYQTTKRAAVMLLLLFISFVLAETDIQRGPVKTASHVKIKQDGFKKRTDGPIPEPFFLSPEKTSPKKEPATTQLYRSNVILYHTSIKQKIEQQPGKSGKPAPYAKLFPVIPYPPLVTRTAAQKQAKRPGASFRPYWTLTAAVTQEWAQYNLENDAPDNNGGQQTSKTRIANRENHEPSFMGGLLATWQFKKNWAIQTGILFSNTAISIDPQTIYAAKENNGVVAYKYNLSSGYAFVKPDFGASPALGDSISTASAQHNLQCLSLPILLRYKMTKGRFSIAPALGFTANIITGATVRTEVEDAVNSEKVTINKLEGTKSFYFGLMAKADLQYQFAPNWSIDLLPSFRYALSPITQSSAVKTFPYSFGAGIGLTYRF